MLSSEEGARRSESFTTSTATLKDMSELEVLVNLAYRGGKSTVAWKNEDHLVEGPRIVPADLEKYINATESSTILFLRDDKKLMVGTVHVEKHDDEAHIGMLAVHPDFQNFGLGKKLLHIGEDHARDFYKCKIGKMFVFAGREELLAWYRKMGYELTGETMPFFGPDSGLTPKVENAHFVVVSKNL